MAEETAEEAPAPAPAPSPTVSAEIPGFTRLEDPMAEETAEEAPAPSPSPLPPAPGIGEDVGADLEDDGPTPASPTARRARWRLPSTPFRLRAGTVDKATRDGVLELVGAALELFGRALQARALPPARYGPNDAWIPDELDQQAIAEPIANMTARRIPTGLGAESDVADILTLTAGTAGYAIKNSRKTAAYRRAVQSGAWSAAEGAAPGAEHEAAGMNGAGQ